MNKVYACSDLHGMKNLYEQISDFLDDTDKVYCLGDCGDRGDNPWEVIKLVRNDPRFIYIKGNHEDMLENTMRAYNRGIDKYGKGDPYESFRYERNFQLLSWNGGAPTFYGWIEDGADPEWIDFFRNLPTYEIYKNKDNKYIFLSHAGLTPMLDENGGTEIYPEEYDLIWDRDHLMDDWVPAFENTIVVHGHTPIPSMPKYCWHCPKEQKGIITYCDGHKINIDNGAFHTGKTILLDLDTFETKRFYDEKIFQEIFS